MDIARPEHLVPINHFTNHGFTWVLAEPGTAHATVARLQASGYDTDFHPAASPPAFAAVRRDVRKDDIGQRPPAVPEVAAAVAVATFNSAAVPGRSTAPVSQLNSSAPRLMPSGPPPSTTTAGPSRTHWQQPGGTRSI
jgi:hypothetical protein